MVHCFGGWPLCIAISVLVLSSIPCSISLRIRNRIKTKSAVFLSPEFELGPGSVINRYYHNIDFPRGHIALKSFNAEVVDEAGNPVPLHETYLHHWVIYRYYQPKGNSQNHNESNIMFVYNSGICQEGVLGQYYGLGSETRKTPTFVPDPYGIEVGNPAEIPDGYEERWMVNVHAIDTRGTEDGLGCTECRCDLYNVSKDEYGRPLRPDYRGGLLCCYDQTQCRVRKGFQGAKRSLYLRYTVEWVGWTDSILPVKIYIFDVTDTWNALNSAAHECKVEYEVVESYKGTGMTSQRFIDTKRTRVTMPTGGYVVYGVAHQHTGGTGSTLYREDGSVMCSSIPIYGRGKEAGDEAGYIVGMSTCYPQPGSVKILDGETLTLVSNYSSSQAHTGVMGLFYILVADQLPNPLELFTHSPL
ncbi:Stress up-regulated Nod [Parasponia andersonii]|uniref:Stress up-regulated Nod n=1 Tax=Parasponia andersonii TaxID=3476 RepID=A0A2P5DD72_PARAD|nr:Stress up-regulated Nod [Parasponia andersonii]